MTEQEQQNAQPEEGDQPAEGDTGQAEETPQPAAQAAAPKGDADAKPAAPEGKAKAAAAKGDADAKPAASKSDAGDKAAAPAKKKPPPAAPAGPSTAVVAAKQRPGQPIVSRRTILQIGFWSGLGAFIAGIAACGVDLIYPTSIAGFGGTVSAGEVSKFPPGSKTQIVEGRFWMVHLTQEQGGPGLLALWWKCPHLGCTVPWKDTFVWPDPTTGAPKKGWFRCPCHGSTYTDAGVRVFGPAPRSMDTMKLTIENGRVIVDTGATTPGAPDNAERATRI